jgi:predicted amidohydrolase YtcJ
MDEVMELSENILISDGTLFTMNNGEEPFRASLLIEHGRVSGIFSEPPGPGELPRCTDVVDAEGFYIAPGFRTELSRRNLTAPRGGGNNILYSIL